MKFVCGLFKHAIMWQSVKSSKLSLRLRSKQMMVLEFFRFWLHLGCQCTGTPVQWSHPGAFLLWFRGVRFLCFGELSESWICDESCFYLNSKNHTHKTSMYCCVLMSCQSDDGLASHLLQMYPTITKKHRAWIPKLWQALLNIVKPQHSQEMTVSVSHLCPQTLHQSLWVLYHIFSFCWDPEVPLSPPWPLLSVTQATKVKHLGHIAKPNQMREFMRQLEWNPSFKLIQFSSVPWLIGMSEGQKRSSSSQEALVSSSGMGRGVHSLMLSIQHFLHWPRCHPPSKIPWRMVLERLSWRVTCLNHASFCLLSVTRRVPVDLKGSRSCSPPSHWSCAPGKRSREVSLDTWFRKPGSFFSVIKHGPCFHSHRGGWRWQETTLKIKWNDP